MNGRLAGTATGATPRAVTGSTPRAAGITALRDLKRRARDPWALVSWLAVPFFIGLVITLLTGGSEGPKPKAKLLVADLDDSFVSRMLLGAFGQDRMKEIVDAETVSLEDGQERIDAGEASGFLIIPEGFGRAVLYEEPTRLELITNPSQSILPKILTELTNLLAEADFYAHRLLGPELRLLTEMIDIEKNEDGDDGDDGDDTLGLLAEARTADLAVRVRRKMEAASTLLDPVVLELEEVEPENESEDDEPQPGFALLLLPGLVLMAMVFTADGLAADLWTEREQGTLDRIRSSTHGLAGLLPGKALAAGGVLLLIASAISVPAFAYHGLGWQLLPFGLLWLVAAGLFFYFLFALVQMSVADRRSGTIATQLLIFPLLMVGGSFFPLEALPAGIARIGALTPNGWMGEQLKAHLLSTDAVTGGGPSLLLPFLGLGAAILGLALVGQWRLRRFGKAG